MITRHKYSNSLNPMLFNKNRMMPIWKSQLDEDVRNEKDLTIFVY